MCQIVLDFLGPAKNWDMNIPSKETQTFFLANFDANDWDQGPVPSTILLKWEK